MAGSGFGDIFKVTTWGESHGKALGVCIDGCPAGLALSVDDIQIQLDKRKPGGAYATKRSERDKAEILSGVFDNITTGCPITVVIMNEDARSADYSTLSEVFRPSHADFGYHIKYGIRDYRGGGRASGRETAARVAAGAIAIKALREQGVEFLTYTESIGEIKIDYTQFDESFKNPLNMPDKESYKKAAAYLDKMIEKNDSSGSVVCCLIKNVPPGLGEPVFDKTDALLSHAIFSIGAVKAVEIGAGTEASKMTGSAYNDSFYYEESVKKRTNNAGGITGGITDTGEIIIRAHFKPTPSIAAIQNTCDISGNNVDIEIKGRHDPVIAPRAGVVVESMAAIVLFDLILRGRCARH